MKFNKKEKLIISLFIIHSIVLVYSLFTTVDLIQAEASSKEVWLEISFSILCFFNALLIVNLNKKTFKKLEGK